MQTPTLPARFNMIFLQTMLAVILITTILIAGCISQTATSPAPAQQTSKAVISISEIIKNPSAYNKTDVLVRGKIVSECGSGCWFMLSDGMVSSILTCRKITLPSPVAGITVALRHCLCIAGMSPCCQNITTDGRNYP
jgi:hypothetical protein